MSPINANADREIVKRFQTGVKSFSSECREWLSQISSSVDDLVSARQGELPLIRLEKLLGQAPALLDRMDGLRELANRIHLGALGRRA
jgi:hypothetical protein